MTGPQLSDKLLEWMAGRGWQLTSSLQAQAHTWSADPAQVALELSRLATSHKVESRLVRLNDWQQAVEWRAL